MNNSTVGRVAPALTPIEHRSLTKINVRGGIDLIAEETTTFVWLFASVLRSDPTSRPVIQRVKATSEKNARLQLVYQYVLMFAGRLPNQREPE